MPPSHQRLLPAKMTLKTEVPAEAGTSENGFAERF
jgi:hypothetical protein